MKGFRFYTANFHRIDLSFDNRFIVTENFNVNSDLGGFASTSSSFSIRYINFSTHTFLSDDVEIFTFNFFLTDPNMPCIEFDISDFFLDSCNPSTPSFPYQECADTRTLGGQINVIGADCELSNDNFADADVTNPGQENPDPNVGNPDFDNAYYSAMSNTNGFYSGLAFTDRPYTLVPEIADWRVYVDCGVDGIDADRMRAHILGTNTLDKVWKYHAADVDDDNTITTLDLVMAQRMYLFGNIYNAGIWEFLRTTSYLSASVTGNSIVPFVSEESTINPGFFNNTFSNFYAVKVGDVDGSCSDCYVFRSVNTTSDEDFILSYTEEGFEVKAKRDLDNITGITLDFGHRGSIAEDDYEFPHASQEDDLSWAYSNDEGDHTFYYWGLGNARSVSIPAGETILRIKQTYKSRDITLTPIKSTVVTENEYIRVNNTDYEITSANEEFMVYPNPTRDLLYIQDVANENTIDKVDLIDVSGRIVHTQYQSNDVIDVSHLNSGIYLARIHSNKEVYTYKISVIK